MIKRIFGRELTLHETLALQVMALVAVILVILNYEAWMDRREERQVKNMPRPEAANLQVQSSWTPEDTSSDTTEPPPLPEAEFYGDEDMGILNLEELEEDSDLISAVKAR